MAPWLVAAVWAAALCSGSVSAKRTRRNRAAAASANAAPAQPGTAADPEAAVAELVLAARAATGDNQRAHGLWQQVLQLSPTHYEANRAVGMALITGKVRGRLEQSMPHLKQALIQASNSGHHFCDFQQTNVGFAPAFSCQIDRKPLRKIDLKC